MGRPLDEIPLTAIRRPGAWNDAGDWIMLEGDEQEIAFVGGRPQPVGPEVIDMLPEGARSVARYVMFVHDDQPDLITISEDGTTAADVLEWRGKEHLLVAGEDWRGLPDGHIVYGLIEYGADETRPKVPA